MPSTYSGGGGVTVMMQLRKLANHPLLLRYKYSDDMIKVLTKRLLEESKNVNSRSNYSVKELSLMSDFDIHYTVSLYPVST